MILEGRSWAFLLGQARPFHNFLLRAEGFLLGASLRKAVFIGLLFHLLIGWVTWKRIIPRMPSRAHVPATLGLIAFLLHPVAFQTVVSVAQRSEILGLLFGAFALATFFRARNTGLQTGDYWKLGLCGLGAVLCKEPDVLIPLGLTFALGFDRRNKESRLALLLFIPVVLLGIYLSGFSEGSVQNASNYQRAWSFFESVRQGKIVSNEDSQILPLRDLLTNLKLQVELFPQYSRIVVLPFGLVKDYGLFPFGKETYLLQPLWFGLGLFLFLGSLGCIFGFRKRFGGSDWILISLPFAIVFVFWVIPVYDTLVLYRLYAVTFLTFVLALPLLLKAVQSRNWIAGPLCAVCCLGGLVRSYEISDPLRQARLELARRPDNYRFYLDYEHALLKFSGVGDCKSLLEPALLYTPSTSLIYGEWAWCEKIQKNLESAAFYAMKSLEQEGVPENVQLAVTYLPLNANTVFPIQKIHPRNLEYLKLRRLNAGMF